MNFKMLKLAEDPKNLPEIFIYMFIEGLGDFLWTMKRAVHKHDAKPENLSEDCQNAYHDQQQLVELLKTRPEFNFADHDEYMRWYRWWNHWHKYQLTDKQWRELDSLIKWDGTQTEEQFAAWRPTGNWKADG